MISIIVPVYNVEKYVERCIRSILAQTFEDFELILVDDGSTDRSGEICDTYGQQDTRIYVLHQKNRGLSGARNAGLEIASGEYLTYIDSDDWVGETYLEELYNNAVKHNASVSICCYAVEWENNSHSRKKIKEWNQTVQTLSGREAAKKIVAENDRKMITAWGKLYRKELKPLLIYPLGKTHEDEFVTYRVLYESERVALSEKPLYFYLQREASIMSRGYSEKRLDKVTALKEGIEYFRIKEDEELERSAQKRYLLNLQIAWYRVNVFLPERKDLCARLRKEWQESNDKYKRNIRGCVSVVDWVALKIFAISPYMYKIMAGFYEYFCQEV